MRRNMKPKHPRIADGVCRMCACEEMEPADGCPQRIHLPHPMEKIRDTDYSYCPIHDRPSELAGRR